MTDFATERKVSRIETMLGFLFTSDPRGSRFPIPKIPKQYRDKFPGELYTEPVTVTPQIARDWLEHRIIRKEYTPKELLHDDFCPNRRFLIGALVGSSNRKGWIDTLKDGELRKIHQGIAFTPDGYICDGQHRLAAVALSGVTATFLVAVDVDWKGFSVMDSGRTRSAGQLLGDMPHADMCAASARYILPVLAGVERAEYYDKMAHKDDVINLVQGWTTYHSGEWSKEVSSASSQANIPNTPLMATVMMALAAGADPFEVHAFLAGLRKNFNPRDYITIGTDGDDPRWILRNAFSNQGKGKRSFSSDEQYGNVGLIRRSMEVWLNKEKVKALTRTSRHRSLPPVWNADKVRAYHADHVN